MYKQGQAGVTKASVTIVFNNNDVSTSPVGYESHKQITVTRQVVIGGKNKYMINGHTVQQSQVQNLFHSVQLNVNNPHFLIMQGRITKVLNMKPEEILGMIEEAAGTRMFETKKQAALKTIEKKQLKVDELTKCMDQEITPTLANLRTEKTNYLTWQSNNTELERLERFCIAHEFREAEKFVTSSENDKKVMLAKCSELEGIQKDAQSEADKCTKKIQAIENEREAQQEGPFKELKKNENELSKELVKANTLFRNHKETLSTDKENVNSLKAQKEAALKSVEAKKIELASCNEAVAMKEMEVNKVEAHAKTMSEKYQNAVAGMADDSSAAAALSLPEQVAMWEKKVQQAVSQIQQGALKADHAKNCLKDLKKSSKDQQATHAKIMKEAEALKKQIDTAEARLASTSQLSPGEESAARSRINELKISTANLRTKVDMMTTSLQTALAFEFKDPEKGFDRSRVKGLVAKLVRVNDRKAATALEITAGSKLYQVIVDNEVTGSMLIKKGELKKRYTILPLNKLSARCTDASKVDLAKSMARKQGGTANLALELVGFEEDVRRAMEYTFGNTIICDRPDIAKQIAFDKNIRTRTVTLDGDTYDPSGTLTGGSKNSLGSLLSKIEELSSMQGELDAQTEELDGLQKKITRLEADLVANKDLVREIELKRHSLQILEDKMAESSYAQTMQEIAALESQLQEIEAEAVALRASEDAAKDELKKLKTAEKDIKKQREKAMKDMENAMRAAQKEVKDVKQELTALRHKRDTLQAEVVAAEGDVTSLQDQIKAAEDALVKMEKQSDALEAALEAKREAYDDAKAALAEKQAELNACSEEIKALEATKEKALKSAQNASLEARKLAHKLTQWEKDFKDAAKTKNALLKQHPWIEKEQAYFGLAGSDYDFGAKDVEACKKRFSQVKSEQDRLAKKINKKVMGMIEKAESEYEELARKKQVILNDKQKIEDVIKELDVKKSQALQTTWVKVNRDFGSIFSTLLPGTHAKLEPPEGSTVSEGLEVKVAFNGVWKESLSELSGGQRSLLALSLILSLLLFKPAPMYILDEVDAALDLSHTQNIGLMLRTHFSTSQFIVVSLKEGMFNNANVIFRTRFVDGVSQVTRTVVGKGITNATAAEDDDEVAPPSKKKSKSVAAAGGKGSSKSAAKGIENTMIEA